MVGREAHSRQAPVNIQHVILLSVVILMCVLLLWRVPAVGVRE